MKFEKGFIIKTEKERCLNHWHHGVLCNHCTSRCPTDAIVISNHQTYHDSDACVGCGLCVSSCPTQVFVAGQWDENAILSDVEGNGWDRTHIFCGFHDKPFNAGDARTGAIRVPACLAGLSKGLWFILGKLTQVELHLEHCDACELGQNLPHITGHVAVAAEWLLAAGIEPQFFEVLQPNSGKAKKKHRAIDSGLKITSRRDLFLGLLERGKKTISTEFQDNHNERWGRAYVPDWVLRMEEAYPKELPEDAKPAFWPSISINADCKGCGLCTSYCPTGALQLNDCDDTYVHLFNSGRCIDCRICELFCPLEAIHRSREQKLEPFRAVSIRTAKGANCSRCGMSTVETENRLCHWCQYEGGMEEDLLRACRLILFNHEDRKGNEPTKRS